MHKCEKQPKAICIKGKKHLHVFRLKIEVFFEVHIFSSKKGFDLEEKLTYFFLHRQAFIIMEYQMNGSVENFQNNTLKASLANSGPWANKTADRAPPTC